MTKTGEKFLERLAGIMERKYSRYNAWNVPVSSNEYAEIMKPFKEKAKNILRWYERGLITEYEAAIELTEIADSKE